MVVFQKSTCSSAPAAAASSAHVAMVPSEFAPAARRNSIMSAFCIHEDALYSEISNARKRIAHGHIALTDAAASSSHLDGQYSATSSFCDLWDNEIARIGDFLQAQQQNLEFSAKALLTNVEAALNRIIQEEGGDVDVEDFVIDESENGPTSVTDVIQSWRYKTDELVDACLKLQQFATQNKETLEEIGTLADEKLQTACVGSLKRRFASAPWKTGPNSSLIVVLSDIYSAIRTAEDQVHSGASKDDSQWIAPSSFERKTTKYWVKEDQLTDLLLSAVAEAPLLVYGKSGRLTSKAECLSQRSEGDKLWDQLATPITSIYLDSPKMGLYKERLDRREGAQLLRARWYGRKPQGNELIFLELKTHHEKWINTKSVKERVTIREKDMSRLLDLEKTWTMRDAEEMVLAASPTLDASGLSKAADRLFRMRELVVKHQLSPCVRTTYLRAAFQSSKSNALRVTIDRNVTMVDESQRHAKSWCLPEDAVVLNNMTTRVPFVVLEVKLAGDDDVPVIIRDLESRGVIQEAAKFSKFLTGAAAFNLDKVESLPYWAEHPAFGPIFSDKSAPAPTTSKAPAASPLIADRDCHPRDVLGSQSDTTSVTSSGGAAAETTHYFNHSTAAAATRQRSRSILRSVMSKSVVDGSGATGSAGVDEADDKKTAAARFGGMFAFFSRKKEPQAALRVAPKRPARVEPKSYFANERTFIQWISAALLLVTISVILLGIDSELGETSNYARKSGIGVCAGAVMIVFYSTFVYFRRLHLLASGSSYGYIDHMGPFILAVSVCTGVVVLLTHFLGEIKFVSSHHQPVFIYERPGECYLHSNKGISKLEYQPSDVMIDTKRNTLMVPSLQRIVAHSLDPSLPNRENVVKTLVEIPNSNIEGLTSIGDRVFALSEGPKRIELIELYWNDDDELTVLHRWKLANSDDAEALAYVPDKTRRSGRLFIEVKGQIHIYNVPEPTAVTPDEQQRAEDDDSLVVVEDTSVPDELDRIGSINNHVLKAGLTELKVSSMFYFEGVAYILHDNEMMLRAWDLDEGDLLAEIPLPRVAGGFSKEWEGVALERREIKEGEGSSLLFDRGNLRGYTGSKSTQLILHLALDTPAQIWSLVVKEGPTRGSLVLPSCAVNKHTASDSISIDESSSSDDKSN